MLGGRGEMMLDGAPLGLLWPPLLRVCNEGVEHHAPGASRGSWAGERRSARRYLGSACDTDAPPFV